jgi:hypothetical protein
MALTEGPKCPYSAAMWKDWNEINELGALAEATEQARKKWWQRGTVPPKWRLEIMALTRKRLSFDAPPEFELRAWGGRPPRKPRQDVRA